MQLSALSSEAQTGLRLWGQEGGMLCVAARSAGLRTPFHLVCRVKSSSQAGLAFSELHRVHSVPLRQSLGQQQMGGSSI